jgi:hypothetical protein
MDLDINGNGFYQISAPTRKGQRFLKQVQGAADGVAYCDDSRLTQDIADGAHRKGLIVFVNGRKYIGDGKVATA